MTLFDAHDFADRSRDGEPSPEPGPASGDHDGPPVVRVVPDVPAMDRELDYAVPSSLTGLLGVGSIVRVPLHGRRVRGWVVAEGVDPLATRELAEVSKLTGLGPDASVLDLCRWAAWRWVGRLPSLLRVASPDRAVRAPSRRVAAGPDRSCIERVRTQPIFGDAAGLLERGPGAHLLTVGPTTDPVPIALAAASLGQALVLTPQVRVVEAIAAALHRGGATVVRWPGGTAGALAGHTVVGGRGAVWAPMPRLAAVVVLDEHDEGLQHESSPTWHAREVAIERARRAGVPCLLVSPMPSLEARAAATTGPVSVSVADRRSGWAPLQVLDRREDDPRTGLFSPALVESARSCRRGGGSVVCVLNRTGRARLLACRSCRSIAECERCAAAVRSPDGETLTCERCGASRPMVCLQCGSSAMKVLRVGVSRARDDLEALLREPVSLVSAADVGRERCGVLIGTEAVLHRAAALTSDPPRLVAFLDADQELLATRYRAAEETLALIVSASRLLGGRDGGSICVQTRRPHHPVIEAALRADPSLLTASEGLRRELLGLPPAAAVAAVGGEAAAEWIERLGTPEGIEVQGPNDGWWLLRAADHASLADAAGAVRRPAGRLRLRVDPVRLP